MSFWRENLKLSELRAIWKSYKGDRFLDRIRPVIRYLSCPFQPLIDAVPKTGAVLDVGCGDGLFLMLLNENPAAGERRLVGIDPDQRKIENVKRLNAKAIEFVNAEVSAMRSESFDCISVVDVMYLLPLEQWSGFLHHCVRCLKPTGLLLVKEVHDRPRWKRLITYTQELISIYVSRMTQGNHPHFESVATYRQYIESAGAVMVQAQQIDSGFPHAHILFLARKR